MNCVYFTAGIAIVSQPERKNQQESQRVREATEKTTEEREKDRNEMK